MPSDARAEVGQQLKLIAEHPREPATSSRPSAAVDPIAQVVVDVGLAHLDRVFEYSVPAELADSARPGCRVKVRFAGKDVNGFIVARTAHAEHIGKLTPLRRVVAAEPVLTPEVLELCRAVARRYAGTLSDVLRLAIPARHARAENALPIHAPTPDLNAVTGRNPWARYRAGSALLARIAAGESPAASWSAAPCRTPDSDWPQAMAHAARAALEAGRGAVLVVPDGGDVERLTQACDVVLGAGAYVRLTADQGPQARYTAWLKVLRGHVRCVIGTRSASFAPVHDLGLVAWWDDGDDSLSEQRAPYPHVREVLAERARLSGAALIAGGFTRTAAIQRWVDDGSLRPVEAELTRTDLPRVIVAGDEREIERSGAAGRARLPSSAWDAAKRALNDGPVLVQVPRRGYLPTMQCQTCRAPARCARCHGPLELVAAQRVPSCRWCGVAATTFECSQCEGTTLRAGVVGARRTAEELGRAFAGVPLIRSGAGEMVAAVGPAPALVIATPGAEPRTDGGYSAVLLLDGWALLDRPVLDAEEEALRRWSAAAALAAPGAPVVLCGVSHDPQLPVVQALVRWAPEWFAERTVRERAALALPPTVWLASVTGSHEGVSDFVKGMSSDIERIGPLQVETNDPSSPSVPSRNGWRLLLRAPLAQGAGAAHEIQVARARRSLKHQGPSLQVRVDPAGALL